MVDAPRVVESILRSRSDKLSARVVSRLALHIIRNLPRDGFALPPENELCRQLGVNRTVLREAVKILEAKGLVRVEHGQGMIARPRSTWSLLDPDVLAWQSEVGVDDDFTRCLCEVREIVEPAASEFAALRASDPQLSLIKECFEKMESGVEHASTYIAADLEFHSAIIESCGNSLLQQISQSIGAALRAGREISVEVPGGWSPSLRLHRLLMEAILRRDPATARSLTTAIVRDAARDMLTVFNLRNQKKPK